MNTAGATRLDAAGADVAADGRRAIVEALAALLLDALDAEDQVRVDDMVTADTRGDNAA